MIKLKPLLCALLLLTRLPLLNPGRRIEFSAREQALSPLFYPIVGLVIGAFLVVLHGVFSGIDSPLLRAAILVVGWVWITGALHLDGLADSVDALGAAHKGPDKVLAVFQDPSSGPFAVVALVAVLLLKVAALSTLADNLYQMAIALCAATISARLLAAVYITWTAYARDTGLGRALTTEGYRAHLMIILMGIELLFILLLGVGLTLSVNLLLGLLLYYWRGVWLKTIGGYTGDCVGALIEMGEAAVLILAVMWLI